MRDGNGSEQRESDELQEAQEALEALAASSEAEAAGLTTAIALPDDPMLWAEALTGLSPSDLVCVDEGA